MIKGNWEQKGRATVARAVFAAMVALAGSSAMAGDPEPDIVVTAHHIDAVRDARTPWDELQNCLRDPACAGAVDAIATQIGIPAGTVGVGGAGSAFTAKQDGEETRYSIPALTGRKVCRVQIRTTSVVPATGDRASLFSLSALRSGVAIYTWTPRQGIGAGRSWWDGTVFVAHVKDGLADEYASSGRCTVPEAPAAAYQCRGASGVNHGLASCGSKDL
jgi:hypothetical protein